MPALLDQLASALAERYQISRELGRGGMATVYLANDRRHDRQVAIKVLDPELAAILGAERFLAEIRTTANLQHPHILPLFDSGAVPSHPDGREAAGGPAFLYYVMPFIDGETLRARLARERQLPVEDAIRIAREAADALAYAHERGIIHRDIKPENILLQRGHALVADFGIALAVQQAGGQRMTQTGLSLGTPAYMSPEQATAEKDLSPRSDVYSLACVLYEMLAGVPPHVGGSAQQTIVRIITETPGPVSDIRKSVPANVAAAIAKALEKLPADRFENAKAFSDALAAPGFTFTSAQPLRSTGSGSRVGDRRALIAMGVVTAAAIAIAGWALVRPTPQATATSLDLELPNTLPAGQDVVISPDGSTLAYTGRMANGQTAILTRRLDGGPEFKVLPGTEGASYPAFSPDNGQIAFRRSDGTVMRMPVGGGGATKVFVAESGYHLHWGTPDLIVFSGPNTSSVVSLASGKFHRLRGLGDRRLFLLPDGSGVLGRADKNVVFYDLRTDSISTLVHDGQHPVYVPGYLLFDDNQGGLSAIRFDLSRHRASGSPVRVLDRVAYSAAARGYSVSNNGTLVWRIGASSSGAGAGGSSRLVIAGFDGRADTLSLPVRRPSNPRYSPNGNLIAYSSPSEDPNSADIYTYNLVTKTNTQITFDGSNSSPVWSPDGTRLVYVRADSTMPEAHLVVKAADNSRADEPLDGAAGPTPTAWPRADLILYTATTATDAGDILSVSPTRGAKSQPYVSTAAQEGSAVLSPDGKLAGYVSSENGEFNIWMRDFPKPIGKWKLSNVKGQSPRWSPDGKFLYYMGVGPAREQDTLWRVQIDRTPSIQAHAPTVAATLDVLGVQQWDLHPDGKRFVYAIAGSGTPRDSTGAAPRNVLILNWLIAVEAALSKPKKS